LQNFILFSLLLNNPSPFSMA